MKILFLSDWGCAVPLAMHFMDYGHRVRFHIENKDSQDVGDGFVPKIKDYKPSLEWADLVISDHTTFGKVNDEIRAKGIPVVGGNKMTDALEENRSMGQKLFKSVGMTVLESEDFKTVEEAVSYIQDNPKLYVIKLSGKAQNDKTTTYVGESEDGSDVIAVLEHMAEKMEDLDTVEIQERVKGTEVAVSGFFNGEKFIGKAMINFEHKKLMPGPTSSGWGPNTSEMGTTGLWVDYDNPLAEKILGPMVKPLKAMEYHGVFDINMIMVEKGGKPIFYPLEMTNRFGWPALPMEIETLKDNDLAEFYKAMATGDDFDLNPAYPLSMCLVIGIPPLPYNNQEIFDHYSKDLPVLFREGIPEGVYPCEVKLEDDGKWRVAGNEGCIAVVAAGGNSIEECSKACYELAEQVIVPNKMVRDDIGRTTDQALEKLENLGLMKMEAEV